MAVAGRAGVKVVRHAARGRAPAKASVPEEVLVRLGLNGSPVAELPASPVAVEELAVGHLALAGLLRQAGDIHAVMVDPSPDGDEVAVEVEARPRRAKPPAPALPRGRVAPRRIHELMKAMLEAAELYREGGGVHTSALAEPDGLLFLEADIGKANTVDRLAAQVLLQQPAKAGSILLTTGRLTGTMVRKGLGLGCGVLASLTSPTSAGVGAAHEAGATLVGYARGGSLTVYTHARRVGGR